MSSKRSIPKKIRDCSTPPNRKKHKRNPKQTLRKIANATPSCQKNMISKKEWSVWSLGEFEKKFLFFFQWCRSNFWRKIPIIQNFSKNYSKIKIFGRNADSRSCFKTRCGIFNVTMFVLNILGLFKNQTL